MSQPRTRKVLVTDRGELPHDTLAQTPAGLPDLCVQVMTPVALLAVRVLRVYLMSVLGLLGASQSGVLDPIAFEAFQPRLFFALQAAVAPAVVSALWNLLELLAKVDQTHPERRG